MSISSEERKFLERMDPSILEMEGMEGFDETVGEVHNLTQALMKDLCNGRDARGFDLEQVAYVLTMHSQAIEKLVEQLEELKPAIRFITSVLLGNSEEETDG